MTELLVVLAIVAILAVVTIPISGYMRARAEKVKCIGNLRVLHSSLGSYTNDRGHWPQDPADYSDENEYWGWWIEELEGYGMAEETWACPAERRDRLIEEEPGAKVVSYIPTDFGPEQNAAYRYAGQPWAMEIGSPHDEAAHLLFPDGSVRQYVNNQDLGEGGEE